MDDKPANLSVKLTKIVVGAAIVLGVLVGLGQLVLDVFDQRQNSRLAIQQVVETIYPFAAATAYELDNQAAEDIMAGLVVNPLVRAATMLDDKGEILGTQAQVSEPVFYASLLTWALTDFEQYQVDLYYPNFDELVGTIDIDVDTGEMSAALLDRAFSNLVFGIVRNVLLAIILLYIFGRLVNSPLTAISKNLEQIDAYSTDQKSLKYPAGHKQDELGQIVTSINSVLERERNVSEQLRRSQKMEAVGQLGSGIAHDFNNILGVIMGNLEFLRDRVAADDEAIRSADVALRSVDRGAELTRRLLNYSSAEVGTSEVVMVNDFIEGIAQLISKSLTVSIKTTFRLSEDTWPISINSGNFQDCLLNLALNARDAMPDGGELTIEASNTVLDDTYESLNPQVAPGEYVVVSVIDNGMGMTKETSDKAVEPFFSTKEKSKGTGLGLSMVYGFVQRSGGHLKIYSELGEGTAVRLYLPRARDNEQIDQVVPAETVLPRGEETILLVDDELDLLVVAAQALGKLGYKTITAESGADAIGMLRAHSDIDLLLSDVIMPGGINGYQLALTARDLQPTIKVLLTSGFTRRPEESGGEHGDYLRFLSSRLLHKPYNQFNLAQAVRRALDEDQ